MQEQGLEPPQGPEQGPEAVGEEVTEGVTEEARATVMEEVTEAAEREKAGRRSVGGMGGSGLKRWVIGLLKHWGLVRRRGRV